MRPHVICHMMATIDGRIVTGRWPDLGDGWSEYERTAATLEADAWMCGRITMEAIAADVREVKGTVPGGAPRPAGGAVRPVHPDRPVRPDFVAPGAKARYAVALDPRGRLIWEANDIDGDHIVAVLGERVPDEYLAGLRERGVSYLLVGAPAGEDAAQGQLDLAAALEKLLTVFGIRTLLLEGGGRINGAMLRAGLTDEVSLLVVPVADGAAGTPSLFDVAEEGQERSASRLALQSVERRAEDVLWLRYRVESANE